MQLIHQKIYKIGPKLLYSPSIEFVLFKLALPGSDQSAKRKLPSPLVRHRKVSNYSTITSFNFLKNQCKFLFGFSFFTYFKEKIICI